MAIIETLEATLKPWSDYYGNHKMLQAGVEYLHIGALLVGGGFALSSDRAALRALRAGQEEKEIVLREFSTIHKPVIVALVVIILSGLTMLSTDIGTFLTSPVFWTKMTLVALLLANGYLVMRTEQQLNADPAPGNRAWARFKFCAVASIVLWLSTPLAGVILLNS
jgi:thiosulfate reductase cytochrome b subunit